MKILFIAPTYTGGYGVFIMRIYRELARHGFEVSLFKVPHIPIKNLKNPSFAIFGAIKALVNTDSYDIVHAFNVPSAIAMRCIRAKKRVLSIHGVFSDQIGMIHSSVPSRLVALAESRAIQWADKMATDSEASRRRYMEKLGVDFECTISPLDPDEFIDIPDVPKKKTGGVRRPGQLRERNRHTPRRGGKNRCQRGILHRPWLEGCDAQT